MIIRENLIKISRRVKICEVNDIIQNVTEGYNDVINAYEECRENISQTEQEINDILHVIEFASVDGAVD